MVKQPLARELPVAEEPESAVSVGSKTRTGATWSAATAIVVRLTNVSVGVIVARIISPADLGIYVIALVIYSLLFPLATLGFDAAIARLDLDADKLGPTVTTLVIIASFVIGGAMIAFAEPLTSIAGSRDAVAPVRVLAISIMVYGISAVPLAQISRTFRQNVTFRANVSASIAGSAALLLFVQFMPGALAYAWSDVVARVTIAVLVIGSVKKCYLPGMHLQYVIPLIRFSAPAALSKIVFQVTNNADNVIIGRSLNTSALGIYSLAFNVASWPYTILSSAMADTVVPAFSSSRRHSNELHRAVLRSVRTTMLLACPVAAFVGAFANPLVEILYGAKWLDTGKILMILAPFGVIYALGFLCANILHALGNTLLMLVLRIATLIPLAISLFVAVRFFGIAGAATAHVIVGSMVTTPLNFAVISKVTGTRFTLLVKSAMQPAIASAATAAAMTLVAMHLDSPLLKLILGFIGGAFIYFLITATQLQNLQLVPSRITETRWFGLLTMPARFSNRAGNYLALRRRNSKDSR